MTKTMRQRGKEATRAYLERVGLKFYDEFDSKTMVFLDGTDMVAVRFIVENKTPNSIGDISLYPKSTKKSLRRRGVNRFDTVSLFVLEKDRALLRHERGSVNIPG